MSLFGCWFEGEPRVPGWYWCLEDTTDDGGGRTITPRALEVYIRPGRGLWTGLMPISDLHIYAHAFIEQPPKFDVLAVRKHPFEAAGINT